MRIPSLQSIKENWRADLAAAVSVSFIAIPQALAYATMAGLPPYIGLYATSIPTFFAAFFSTSRVLSTGPVAIISLLTAASLSQLGTTDPVQILTAAAILSILVGIFQIVLGLVRAGTVINFIAHPVLSGFTTAAAFIIWFSQVPKLLGIVVSNHAHFYQIFIETIRNLSQIDASTAFIGMGSIFALMLFKKLMPKAPAALLVVVAGTLMSMVMQYSGPIVGSVPNGFEFFDVKNLLGFDASNLLVNAFVIAVVGFVSGISIVKSLAIHTRDKVNPNKELFAQGAANISSGLVGSFPVAGSVSRTALNMNAGAKTRMSSMFLGIISILVMLFFTPYLYYLTYASLAAIIMVAVFELIDFKEIFRLLKSQPRDGAVAAITLGSTLLFAPHLDIGILIGIGASVLAHMHRSATPHMDIFFCHDVDYLHSHHYHLKTYPSNEKVLGVSIHSSLSFANASLIYEKIMNELRSQKKKPKYILLIASSIGEIDASAEKILLDLHADLKEEKIQLLFAGIKSHVEESLRKTEFYDFVGGANIYPEINLALKAINDRETKYVH